MAAALVTAVGIVVALWTASRPASAPLLFVPKPFTVGTFVVASSSIALVWTVTGGVLAWLRPRNALGWLILVAGVSHALALGLTAWGGWLLQQNTLAWPAYLGPALYLPGWLIPPTLLLALYPDGRPHSRWWRWPVAGAAVAIVVRTVSVPVPTVDPTEAYGWAIVPKFPDRLGDLILPTPTVYDTTQFVLVEPDGGTPLAPSWWGEVITVSAPAAGVLLLLSLLAIWAGVVPVFLRSEPPRRQQLAWMLFAVMPLLGASLYLPLQFANVLVLASLMLSPVSVAIGVLRYRLLGIETVLRRGLVYGTFSLAIMLAYVVAAATVGAALDNRWISGAVAAGMVAIGMAPARTRLQDAADRLIYGERRDPMRALTQLGTRVATGGELDLLPGALHSVTHAVRAPGALVIAPDGRVLAAIGVDPAGGAALPMLFGGRLVGELQVAPRGRGERYTAAENQLLSALALQVAVVVRAVGLTEALEAERDRVVTATATERDRLRGDLHDGLGPSLSGVALGLQALADRIDAGDRAASGALLDRIQDEVGVAVTEVRSIIDGLRPTALDRLGLPDAIRRHASTVSTTVPVRVDAADLPTLPSTVENAAYRITTEALTNAARHARAREVQVTLAATDGALELTVSDDGCGVGAAVAGVGLTSMRRRAETLGGTLGLASGPGGTTITATLPLEQP